MANWSVINAARLHGGFFGSDDSHGFNGAFAFSVPGEARKVFVIASDAVGWQHVSVSFGAECRKTPSWEVMCHIKELFWEPEDTVIQLHPPRSRWVNNHAGCLHLWRCTDGRAQPLPPTIMVGIQGLEDVAA